MHVNSRINTQRKHCLTVTFVFQIFNTVLRLYLIFRWIPDELLRVNVRIPLLFSCCVRLIAFYPHSNYHLRQILTVNGT